MYMYEHLSLSVYFTMTARTNTLVTPTFVSVGLYMCVFLSFFLSFLHVCLSFFLFCLSCLNLSLRFEITPYTVLLYSFSQDFFLGGGGGRGDFYILDFILFYFKCFCQILRDHNVNCRSLYFCLVFFMDDCLMD